MRQWGQWIWSSCGLRLVWRCCVVCLLLCSLPAIIFFRGLRSLFMRCQVCVFFTQWLRSPAQLGAVFPSSVFLARKIAQVAHAVDCSGYIVELGAGLGAVTAQLLESGIPPERLIVLERSSLMANQLRSQFPNLTVIEGDAACLSEYLKDYLGRIKVVVSSLPLRSLSDVERGDIFSGLQLLLSEQGTFIQYTYALSASRSLYPAAFESCSSSLVWRNVPPAKVECFSIR